MLEESLRDDVIAELNMFGGRSELCHVFCLSNSNVLMSDQRLLLHTETPDGSVIPVWEEVSPENVCVLKDVMEARRYNGDVELVYARIPMTAERPPDFSDLSDLIDIMVRNSGTNAPMIINCQLGRGRSTMTSVSALEISKEFTRVHLAALLP